MGAFKVRLQLARVVTREDAEISWGDFRFSIVVPFSFIETTRSPSKRAKGQIFMAVTALNSFRDQISWKDIGQEGQDLIADVHRDLISGVHDLLFHLRVAGEMLYSGVRGDGLDQKLIEWIFTDEEKEEFINVLGVKLEAPRGRQITTSKVVLPLPPHGKNNADTV